MPADYLLTDVSTDCQSISNNEHGLGSEKYLKTHAFSPSMNLEKETSALRSIPSKSELKNSTTAKVRFSTYLKMGKKTCLECYHALKFALKLKSTWLAS